MDYKEKYEKALEWMKSIYPTMQGSDKEDAEHYFPELAESEDERMINGLQGFLSAFGSDYFGTGGWQKFDDWLEKQKEQKDYRKLYEDIAQSEWFKKAYVGKSLGEEQKPEGCSEDEKIRKELVAVLEDLILPDDQRRRFLTYLEKQKEQKPAELSEEDEAHRDFILELLEDQIRFFKKDAEGEHCVKQIRIAQRWLKSLHNRPKSSDTWKPSEEQMYSLGSVVKGAGEATEGSIAYHLKELYNQLKVIKEEK